MKGNEIQPVNHQFTHTIHEYGYPRTPFSIRLFAVSDESQAIIHAWQMFAREAGNHYPALFKEDFPGLIEFDGISNLTLKEQNSFLSQTHSNDPSLRVNPVVIAAGVLLATGLLVAAYGLVRNSGLAIPFLDEFYTNISTELISIAITVLVIDQLAYRHQARIQERTLKRELIAKVANELAADTKVALAELADRNWLYNGSLRGSNFHNADWSNARIRSRSRIGADLRFVNFTKANLSFARFDRVSFEGADLHYANIEGAQMIRADFTGARLFRANLQNSRLFLPCFDHAHLNECDFTGSRIYGIAGELLFARAHSLRHAIMPDGSLYDGRFNLLGDLEHAIENGINPNDDAAMTAWYGIALQDSEHRHLAS